MFTDNQKRDLIDWIESVARKMGWRPEQVTTNMDDLLAIGSAAVRYGKLVQRANAELVPPERFHNPASEPYLKTGKKR